VSKNCNLKVKTFLILLLAGVILINPFFNSNSRKGNTDFFKTGMSTEFAEASSFSTSVIITVCGNGVLDAGEICDDGSSNGQYTYSAENKFCNTNCDGWAPYCGDGQVQSGYGEECDDGNNVSGDGCSASCKSEAPPGGGGGGGGVFVPPAVLTKVVIKGKAYPLSLITLLQDGRVATTIIADSQANFTAEITDLTPGIYTFSVWASDEQGRKSIAFSFTTNIAKDMTTTVSGIFLPPTIELSRTLLRKGETFNILGQTAPESDISISVNSSEIIKKVQAETDGTWFYSFDTTLLEEGSHTARAKATSPEGLLSTFSQTLAFNVGKEIAGVIKKADINKDQRVNLVDFSILLYNWGIPKNSSVDLNGDGKVNLVDFSIMLYWWTG